MAIDKAKGIICKPMPRSWHDRRAASVIGDSETRALYLRLVADRKPYFMRYIYPALMQQYNTYIKNTNTKALREFRMTMDELLEKKDAELTEEEKEFISYYHQRMPVGTRRCVMNRICERFEEEFDRFFLKNVQDDLFDYEIMKRGVDYSASQYGAVRELYEQYISRLQEYAQLAKTQRIDEDESASQRDAMKNEFRAECLKVCPDARQLCDIVLDLCYQKNCSKQFCWDICGEEIIENLLERNHYRVCYPEQDENGTIGFCGHTFSLRYKEIQNDDDRAE